MTCAIPESLPWMSHWALQSWLDGRLTDTGFIFYFARLDSRLIEVAECLIRSTV